MYKAKQKRRRRMKIVAIISIAFLLFVSTTNGQMFVDTLDTDVDDSDCCRGVCCVDQGEYKCSTVSNLCFVGTKFTSGKRCGPGNNYVICKKPTNDNTTPTATRSKKDSEGNTWTVEGDTLTKYVNGRQVFQYVDPKGATLTLPGFSTVRSSSTVKYIHVGTDDGRIVQFYGKKSVFNSQTGVLKTGVTQARTWGPFKWENFGGGVSQFGGFVKEPVSGGLKFESTLGKIVSLHPDRRPRGKNNMNLCMLNWNPKDPFNKRPFVNNPYDYCLKYSKGGINYPGYNPRYNRRLRSPHTKPTKLASPDYSNDDTFDAFDNPSNSFTFDEEDGWQCDTPLPTSLTRKVFAYESILAKPFCGRRVYMDKNDNLLKEGPKTCPYSQTSCEGNKYGRHILTKPMLILRQNVKGSIYYNCYARLCFRFPNGRRLRRILRRRLIKLTPAVRYMANNCKCGCAASQLSRKMFFQTFGEKDARYAIKQRAYGRIKYKDYCAYNYNQVW
jgi:hypothetical protein